MNIMINNYCNLHCPYCFAQQEMTQHVVNNITQENFKKFLDFLKANGIKEVRMIGGEPTLHPHLFDLIQMVIDYNFFDEVLIFSNFTFSSEMAKKFVEWNKKIPINFLPNVNDRPEIRDRIEENYDILTSGYLRGQLNRIGINLYKPNQDLTLWEELIAKYNLETVRWSIVVPNVKIAENFNFKEYFHSFQDVLVRLCYWTTRFGVDLSCDCNGLPICAFDPEMVAEMIKIRPDFFGPMHCYGGAIDVTPDLYVRGCFGCSDYREPLSKFTNYDDLLNDVEASRERFKKIAPQEGCWKCPRYLTTGQFCSCLGYRKESCTNEHTSESCSL